MKILDGKNGSAFVFTDNIEAQAITQIQEILDHEISKNSVIRIMPDVHAGKGCTIGFTLKTKRPESFKIIPNMIGVDISCTVSTRKIKFKNKIDFELIDKQIRRVIPTGTSIRQTLHSHVSEELKEAIQNVTDFIEKGVNGYKSNSISETRCDYYLKSIGTLGGGNHFVEIGEADGDYYLTLHSGSRNFGFNIADYWQNRAIQCCARKDGSEREAIIAQFANTEDKSSLHSDLLRWEKEHPKIKNESAYLSDINDIKCYLEHMRVAQKFAEVSHKVMRDEICRACDFELVEDSEIITNHNYIEQLSDGNIIVRKGAISAKKDELCLIPFNMKDGFAICRGKGNIDWNESAPHGCGRLYSRTQAKKIFSDVELEKEKMKRAGVFSTSVATAIDEVSGAYKSKDEVVNYIADTVDILKFVKPVYNLKGS